MGGGLLGMEAPFNKAFFRSLLHQVFKKKNKTPQHM